MVSNEPFLVIYYAIIIICLLIFTVLDPSIIRLTPIPVICSMLILVSALVNGFEYFRATIFLSFLAQLFTMYVFKNVTLNSSGALIKFFKFYTYSIGIIAIFMLIAGIERFSGIGTYAIRNGMIRNLSGILTNQAYLGYFSSLVICVILLSGKLNFRKYLLMFYLFLMLLASSSRESLCGLGVLVNCSMTFWVSLL